MMEKKKYLLVFLSLSLLFLFGCTVKDPHIIVGEYVSEAMPGWMYFGYGRAQDLGSITYMDNYGYPTKFMSNDEIKKELKFEFIESEKKQLSEITFSNKDLLGFAIDLSSKQLHAGLKSKAGKNSKVLISIKSAYKKELENYNAFMDFLSKLDKRYLDYIMNAVDMKGWYLGHRDSVEPHRKFIIESIIVVEEGTITYKFDSEMDSTLKADFLQKAKITAQTELKWEKDKELTIKIKDEIIAFLPKPFPLEHLTYYQKKGKWPTKAELSEQ